MPDPHAFQLPARKGTEILRVEVGSTLHGTGLPGGEDLDLMAVAAPAFPTVAGLRGYWETWTKRTQPEGAKSGPGDTDLVVHTLQKYLRLALGGNPSILLLLFADDAFVHYTTPLGEELRSKAPAWIASKRAGDAFTGYMLQQRDRFRGVRARHGKTRPELIAQFGYDTKYAMHMVRLAYQGIEFLTSGRLTLPMRGAEAEICRAIRRGDFTRERVEEILDELDALLRHACETTSLPDQPDKDAAHEWCARACALVWDVPDRYIRDALALGHEDD